MGMVVVITSTTTTKYEGMFTSVHTPYNVKLILDRHNTKSSLSIDGSTEVIDCINEEFDRKAQGDQE